MKWVDMAVKPDFSWPDRAVEIPFEGRVVVLQPLTEQLSCSASIYDARGLTFGQGGTALSRFLSRLAWAKGSGILELFVGGSNNPAHPGPMCRGSREVSSCQATDPWDYLYLPSAKSRNADLALALFREGMNVNSRPFAFLSYFKVLNIAFHDGKRQIDWVNANAVKIDYPPARKRLGVLSAATTDIGQYLYAQGRCAVAHAYSTPLVDPDNYGDKSRIEDDLPLMKEIAALFIEQEFGVMSDSTYWQHLRTAGAKSPDLLKKSVLTGGRVVYMPTV